MDLIDIINEVKEWTPFHYQETVVPDDQKIWSYFKIGEITPHLHIISGLYIDYWMDAWGKYNPLAANGFAAVHLSAEFLEKQSQEWKALGYSYVRGKTVELGFTIPPDIAKKSCPEEQTSLYLALTKIWPEDAEALAGSREKFVIPEGIPHIHTIIPVDFVKSKNPNLYRTDEDDEDLLRYKKSLKNVSNPWKF
ncbi:MAG: hypothetical protein Q8R37_02370 [Nanoarchaeota archaeon]|nr:hypothetical protein [Nanoarchaeota archaeon]